jgi:DNA-binding response OmpR family regulator
MAGTRLGRKHPVTILVVDHDPTVLRLLRFLLVSAGYSVLEAHTDAEAIDKLALSVLPIDLVLVDVELPGQGRNELAGYLRTQAPETRILYMSSLSEDDLARAGLWNADVVHKPLGASALVRRIRELLSD